MKQEGRTEQELAESYCFLFPDKSKVGLLAKPHSYMQKDIDKLGRRGGFLLASELCLFCVFQLQWICEKGLSVGHCKINTLGNPSVGKPGAPMLLLYENGLCRIISRIPFYFTYLQVSQAFYNCL